MIAPARTGVSFRDEGNVARREAEQERRIDQRIRVIEHKDDRRIARNIVEPDHFNAAKINAQGEFEKRAMIPLESCWVIEPNGFRVLTSVGAPVAMGAPRVAPRSGFRH